MAENHKERAWELMEKIGTCMLVTWDGERQRARPMAAHVTPRDHAIYFLTDARRAKDDQVERFPIVTMAFADAGGQKYVACTGHATLSNDRAKIRELWSVFAKAWWDSAEDPNIRLLKVEPDDAEIWDGSGTLIATVKMLAAAATGKRPDMGDNRKLTM